MLVKALRLYKFNAPMAAERLTSNMRPTNREHIRERKDLLQ